MNQHVFIWILIVSSVVSAVCFICSMPVNANKIPNSAGDKDEYFEALGIAYGPKARMGELHIQALANAQNLIRQKMAHIYKGIMEDYMVMYGNNLGTDIETKMERSGKQFMNFAVNDTREVGNPEFSTVDEKGNVTCYVVARMYKTGLAGRMLDFILKSEELKGKITEEGLREIINRHIDSSGRYSFSPRVFIPGMQQFYKGSQTKGALFVAGEAVAVGGIVAFENFRALKKAKTGTTHDAALLRKYLSDADRMQNLRNGFIAGAIAIYIWNFIDGCVAKGEERGWIKKAGIRPILQMTKQSTGMTLVLNF